MWTNATLRKALGEHGFFEIKDSISEVIPDNEHEKKSWRTSWVRHEKLVYLITVDGGEPRLEDSSGNPVDIDAVGYRNVNVRSPGEGWQAP